MAPPALGTPRVERVAFELRTRLEAAAASRLEVAAEPIYATQALPRFYAERVYQPAWTVEPGLGKAHDLVQALRESELDGLRPSDYHLASIESLLEKARGAATGPDLLADLDLLLTDAFLILGAHLVSGRIDPETIDPEWLAVRRELDLEALLHRALGESRPRAALQELLPKHPGYGRLRAALARYRGLAAWPTDFAGKVLEDGDARMPALRNRLRASGDLAAEAAPVAAGDELRLDPELLEAVRGFQRRHGLDDDGVIGTKTQRSLSVPLAQRIRQVELNLERWRWLPRELGRRYVLVDIPDFSLRVIEEGAVNLEMRAIVGRSFRRTPVMSDKIRYLVINPYWEVPPTLAVQDKLPEIRKDPQYLARQGFHVLEGWGQDEREIDPATVDWKQLRGKRFPYRLRQDPGPLNALGRIKFMFPNHFNVYVHDTPTRELFRKPERDASSGCVRVEKPVELAEYLLREVPGWTRQEILRVIESLETRTVPLAEPFPIHLQYWTASVDEAGTIHFRQDIYDRDAVLAAALALPAPGD